MDLICGSWPTDSRGDLVAASERFIPIEEVNRLAGVFLHNGETPATKVSVLATLGEGGTMVMTAVPSCSLNCRATWDWFAAGCGVDGLVVLLLPRNGALAGCFREGSLAVRVTLRLFWIFATDENNWLELVFGTSFTEVEGNSTFGSVESPKEKASAMNMSMSSSLAPWLFALPTNGLGLGVRSDVWFELLMAMTASTSLSVTLMMDSAGLVWADPTGVVQSYEYFAWLGNIAFG